MTIDPVCGMTVEPDKAAGSLTHRGRAYWFCSAHCLAKFVADPGKYLGGGDGGSGGSAFSALLKRLKLARE